MKLSKLSIMLIFLLGTVAPVAHGMEANNGSQSTTQEDKYDKNLLELMNLPEEMLFLIVNKVFDTGSLKDIRSILLTNQSLAQLVLDCRKDFSKEIYNAYEKTFPSFDPSPVDTLLPKLKRLIGRDSMAHTLSLLTNEDCLKLLKHMYNMDAKSPNFDTRYTLITLKQLIIQAGKRKLDINFENEQGLTPLMWPTTLKSEFWLANGHTYGLYHVLLQAGADINYKNKNGKTFLDMAIPEVISYIKESEANT